jgi:hypothetical protein
MVLFCQCDDDIEVYSFTVRSDMKFVDIGDDMEFFTVPETINS